MSRALFIQLERLGDLIQTTPLLREYHAAHPDTEIHLLQLAENQPVLAGFAAVNRFHLIPQKQVSELNSQIDKHRDQSPDDAKAILDLLELPHFDSLINLTHGALGCWLASRIPASKKEGGLITNAGDWLWQGAWHAYLLAMLDFRDHNQFNLVDLYRAAGPGGSVSANARPFVAKAQRLPFSLPEGRLIALNPGASRANRRWPEASYAELALELKQQGFVPVLVGARGDIAVCEAVCSYLPHPIDSFCGQTSVAEMAFLLERCELLISNDTGAVHIASAVGTRCIGIYGASAWFRETAPWGSGHLVVQAKLDASLGTISVNDVINVVTASINGSAIKASMSSGVTVWETALDSEDSLGGLSYHAVCGEPANPERFAKHFRRAFSMVLMSGSVAKAANAESPEEADMLAASSALSAVANMAEESLEWLDAKHAPSRDALKTASEGIDRGIRELVATAARLPHIAPPVYWLDWVLRTAPVSDARDALALRVRECARAAEILCTALALYQDECHSAASVHEASAPC